MPIVFVHGVNVRGDEPGATTSWQDLKLFLSKVIAPIIASDYENVEIFPVYWGDVAAQWAWEGASRPRSPLFGQGTTTNETGDFDKALVAADLHKSLQGLPSNGATTAPSRKLVPSGPSGSHIGVTQPQRLKDLSSEQLSDLAATILRDLPLGHNAAQRTQIILIIDSVAYDPDTFPLLSRCPNSQAEINLLQELIIKRFKQETNVAGQGITDWVPQFGENLLETLDRAANLPGFLATRVVAETRKPLNDLMANFLRDVFFYLATRGDAKNPGPIPHKVLEGLAHAQEHQKRRGNEPLIVLTHSMGGQIIYDLVTHFIPRIPQYADLSLNFWCATASQVGFFEELKLFLESDPAYGKQYHNRVPFPNHKYLGYWWNVWDHNDFISFTTHNIIDGVDDEAYNSGLSGLTAHGGYLQRPSFFHTFARKVAEARSHHWRKV